VGGVVALQHLAERARKNSLWPFFKSEKLPYESASIAVPRIMTAADIDEERQLETPQFGFGKPTTIRTTGQVTYNSLFGFRSVGPLWKKFLIRFHPEPPEKIPPLGRNRLAVVARAATQIIDSIPVSGFFSFPG
jgi:hypothetical protein